VPRISLPLRIAVHRHARHLVRVQAHQADHAADVQALLGLGRRVAHDHIVHLLFGQVRHGAHQVLDHLRRQVIGTGETEFAARGLADR